MADINVKLVKSLISEVLNLRLPPPMHSVSTRSATSQFSLTTLPPAARSESLPTLSRQVKSSKEVLNDEIA